MDHETLGGRIPKGERRVRFADSMGMELVSIFLTDLFVLASHTPYTNYHEHRKPPSSRLSSTLQAIQYKHDYHHNHSSSDAIASNNNNNNTTISKSIISTNNRGAAKAPARAAHNTYNGHFHDSARRYAPAATDMSAPVAAVPPPALAKALQHQQQQQQQQQQQLQQQQMAPSQQQHQQQAPPTEYICEFTQPVSLISFKERVKLKKVHLENCYVNTTAGHVSLTCNIRVLNMSYDKSVSVRYTTDDWRTHTDSLASYKPGSSDGWSDQFTSSISIINKLQPGQRIIFAVRFTSAGTSHWDNNGGLNYSVKSKCSN